VTPRPQYSLGLTSLEIEKAASACGPFVDAFKKAAASVPKVFQLQTIAADDVKDPLDRFKCEPYSATITARTCVSRQLAAVKKAKQHGIVGARVRPEAMWGNYDECLNCQVGKRIRKTLES